MLKVFVTSWRSYATHGSAMGRWMTLPMDSAQFENFLESLRTSLNEEEPEWAITDYEWEPGHDFGRIDEYADLEELNDLMNELEYLSDDDKKLIESILEVDGGSLRDAVDNRDNYTLWDGYTLELVAESIIKDSYEHVDIPQVFWDYFDFAGYAENELAYAGYEVCGYGVLETCR